ncbi:UDP-N-acetylmuramoyl-L-alanine--D-glutamate ligase [Kosmotoga arenicorallina]|uniref:UDP-N-acetylmuramoyl-L-alanine--D-glutamate ligase n=1 Tax=Kosmotoga arenicorallina TaxID=688066 RepID=UPI000AF19EF9|nr:UDP-N-acetylmuramoyl-L-alanine--D-glutamate ligase [Kosmotoga arenicorallina]
MKKIGFVGLGASNFELLKYIRSTYPEWECLISEQGKVHEEYRAYLEDEGIFFEQDGHTEKILESDFFVMSPGISPRSAIGRRIISSGKPVTTELEFSLKELKKRKKGVFIGITGTNGKTTTTSMLGHIMKEKGLNVFVGGNIGVPLATAMKDDYDFYVLEVSSFQLNWFDSKEPVFHLSSVLNVAEDHLDYHGTFSEYLAQKKKIITLTSEYSILQEDLVNKFDIQRNAHIVPFSLKGKGLLSVKDGIMNFHKVRLDLTRYITTRHNWENALVAIALAHFSGISVFDALEKLVSYKYPRHRLMKVETIEGVCYIDDSKATNAHAVVKALENFQPSDIVLILAGKGKDESFNELLPRLKMLKKVIIIGDELGLVEKLDHDISYEVVDNMKQAVEKAHKAALAGNVVLFSPGGSSFDRYRNYKERGEDFINEVKNLRKTAGMMR